MTDKADMPKVGERRLVYGTVRGVFFNAIRPVWMEMDGGDWIYTYPKSLVRLSADARLQLRV